jgi:hypothetical protein
MKRITQLLAASFLCSCLHAQNVGIGTTAPIAKLHIKGSQDSSQLVIDANSTQSYNHPLIRLRKSDGTDLLTITSEDSNNIYMGVGAGYANPAVPKIGNVFIGVQSGSVNTESSNTGIGEESLRYNTTGYGNTAVGSSAMLSNTGGYFDVGIGRLALSSNSTGYFNTALGAVALTQNSSGTGNTAVGAYASQWNIGGNYNTAVGFQALSATTNSQYNTALGFNAGDFYDNGYNNVFLGANTNVTGDGYYNVIAIGQATLCTAPSQVTIGNPATDTYRAYANWSNISDGRFKRNIRENVPGLDFITRLRPVTYNLNATDLDAFLHPNKDNARSAVSLTAAKGASAAKPTPNPAEERSKAVYQKALQEKETETVTGFVAQDVEAAAKALGYNFSGIQAPKNSGDVYSLRYADFVVPLVKAVQEQQAMIAELQKRNQLLENRLSALEAKK